MRLDVSLHRVLAQNVTAVSDGPDFDKSTMDGFAIRACDVKKAPVVLEVIEYIPAGGQPRRRLKRGQCSKIATGAMLPFGADAVVMKEEARVLKDNKVKILKTTGRWENVYRKGENFKKGSLLFKKGVMLNMARIALLSSQGIREVYVFDAPTVAILSTGNEIIEPGEKKKAPFVWNSSSSMLSYALHSMDIEPRYLGIVKDEINPLMKKIKRGLESDILIVTGAVSVGELDLVPEALKKVGITSLFHKVAVRPGKPFLFGVHGHRLIFGLAGNPVSSLVGFLLFIKPAIRKMLGQKPGLIIEEGILSKDVYNKSGRKSLFPARLRAKKSEWFVDPLPYTGSADLLSASCADVFLIIDRKQTCASRNSVVKFLRISE